jgi:hypothetical protein
VFFDNIASHGRQRQARLVTPNAAPCALKMVRLAGFRRLQPIIPDRAAFGAAVEEKAHGENAENQCQSPEHDLRTPPTRPIIRSKVWHFQAAGGAGRFAGVRPGTGIVSYPVARNNTACKTKPAEAKSEAFDIEEARRVPGDVFAPWVQDLGLSTDSVEWMCWPMARAVRLGRTMSFGRVVTLSSSAGNKPVSDGIKRFHDAMRMPGTTSLKSIVNGT